MAQGRKPGSLVRATCRTCGATEMRSGTNGAWCCSSCRESGHRAPRRKYANWDKDEARGFVAQAIRDGRLASPKGMTCVDCGGAAVEYEHRDYRKPLHVEPVCRGCNIRRGPAIPRPGTFARLVAAGYVPYRARRSVEKLMRALGRDESAVLAYPKALTIDHWRELVSLFPAA